jgi:hypothetical protein
MVFFVPIGSRQKILISELQTLTAAMRKMNGDYFEIISLSFGPFSGAFLITTSHKLS